MSFPLLTGCNRCSWRDDGMQWAAKASLATTLPRRRSTSCRLMLNSPQLSCTPPRRCLIGWPNTLTKSDQTNFWSHVPQPHYCSAHWVTINETSQHMVGQALAITNSNAVPHLTARYRHRATISRTVLLSGCYESVSRVDLRRLSATCFKPATLMLFGILGYSLQRYQKMDEAT